VDALGTADSFGVRCELRGVVHGIDYNQGARQVEFVLIDPTGSIWVQGNAGNPPYAVSEGDSIRVVGSIRQTNGRTRMQPQRILLQTQGEALQSPTLVTGLDESLEADVVRFENALLVNGSAWGNGTGAGFAVTISDGTHDVEVFVDAQSDLFNEPAPIGFFNLTGLVTQNDNSLPLDEGYAIQPRYLADLELIPTPVISFDPPGVEVWETAGAAELGVTFLNSGPNPVSVDLSLDPSSTATAGQDFAFQDTTLTFPANASAPIMVSLALLDDAQVEGNEIIRLNLSNTSDGTLLGISQLEIEILDNEYPEYGIGTINTVFPGTGQADSLDVRCQIRGVVHAENFLDLANGNLQFPLQDATGGIEVFSLGQTFRYTPTLGDELLVKGNVTQFRGQTRLIVDSLFALSTGNNLFAVQSITAPNEETESELAELECVKVLGPWNNNANVASFFTQATNGPDTFDLRIYREFNDLFTANQPEGWWQVAGIGGQQSPRLVPPFLADHYLAPRGLGDLTLLPNPEVGFSKSMVTVGEENGVVRLIINQNQGNPDPTTISINLVNSISTATEGLDFTFSNTQLTFQGKGTVSDTLEIPILSDNLNDGGESFTLLITSVSNGAILFNEDVTVTIVEGTTNVNDEPIFSLEMFPNPGHESLNIVGNHRMDLVQVFDVQGRKVWEGRPLDEVAQIDSQAWDTGLYLVKVATAIGNWQGPWVKK
ncbi:MAG: Calx-beta domain-containing protein, partial [Bacteroidota bacterium]